MNQVAKKETTELSTGAELNFAEMQAEMGVSKSDIIIPRLFLTQAGSPFKDEANAKMGDIVDSIKRTVVGSEAKPLEIVPIKYYKTWNEYEMAGQDKVFLQAYPVTAQNERQPWDATIDGKIIKRDFCINVVCAIRSELAQTVVPHVITFKRTSTPAGRAVTNQIAMNIARRIAPWASSLLLTSTKPVVEKGKSAYAVYVVKAGTPLKADEAAQAHELYTRMASMDVASNAGVEDAGYTAPQSESFAAAPAANCGDEYV